MKAPKRVINELKSKLADVRERLRNKEKLLRQTNDSYMELRRREAEYQSAINALLKK